MNIEKKKKMGRSVEHCGTPDRTTCHILSFCPTLVLRLRYKRFALTLAIYDQTDKLEVTAVTADQTH